MWVMNPSPSRAQVRDKLQPLFIDKVVRVEKRKFRKGQPITV